MLRRTCFIEPERSPLVFVSLGISEFKRYVETLETATALGKTEIGFSFIAGQGHIP